MDQLQNNVNVRSLFISNALYRSSTMSKEQELMHRCLDVAKNWVEIIVDKEFVISTAFCSSFLNIFIHLVSGIASV